MKKTKKWIGIVCCCITLALILLAAYFYFEIKPEQRDVLINLLSENNAFGLLVAAVVLLVILLVMVYRIATCITEGVTNIRRCGDDIFDEIDRMRKLLRSNRFSYERQVEIINKYYTNLGAVGQIAIRGEIDRLLRRKEQLSGQLSINSECHDCIQAISLSIIASFIASVSDYSNPIVIIVSVGFFALLVIAVPFFKYGRFSLMLDKYHIAIYEYELKKLDELIQEYNQHCEVCVMDNRPVETQMATIAELVKRLRKADKNEKSEIETALQCVESLVLTNYDESNCFYREIRVGNRIGYLIYNKQNGAVNNYIGEENLISEEYSKLFAILKKYNMFTYR